MALWGQEYGSGLRLDDEGYSEIPLKATLISRDYTELPRQVSLKAYCPTPGNQGVYSTCVGWATAYAARTIMEAQRKQWNDPAMITQNAFSGAFIYKLIQIASDISCEYGTHFQDALSIMKARGVPRHQDFRPLCPGSVSIPEALHDSAQAYRIEDFHRLFNVSDGANFKTQAVRKALAQGHPVVFGIKLVPTLYKAGPLWEPLSEERLSGGEGGHALCIIGYDDDKFEGQGAFEIMNSWGTSWGQGGFCWIKYQDFADFAKYAFEMILPAPPQINGWQGRFSVVLRNQQSLPVRLKENTTSLGYYELLQPQAAGTEFRVHFGTKAPAYVYILGSDLTNEIFALFPHQPGISPALNYTQSEIVLPDESHYIRLDQQPGRDYLLVLYAQKALDFAQIQKALRQSSGNFIQRIQKVLGNTLANASAVKFENNQMRFEAQCPADKVVGLLLEINRQ
ncbi:MAG: hypothetical protein OHK0053_05240 [Microscillaceae bacterium]